MVLAAAADAEKTKKISTIQSETFEHTKTAYFRWLLFVRSFI